MNLVALRNESNRSVTEEEGPCSEVGLNFAFSATLSSQVEEYSLYRLPVPDDISLQ